MSPRLTICSVALLLGLGYAENSLTEPPTSPHPAEQDTVPISGAQTSRLPELTSATSISYPLREGVEVCLVSPPGLAVLLQADQSAGLVGDFSVQRFDETLFRLSHLVRACQSSETPADCAQVWIEVLREVSISERGSFWVTFRPAGGGPAIHTLFSYGPRHITYRGTIPDSGPVFIPATAEGIIFELRDSEFTSVEKETVCESFDGVSYQQSTLLGSRGRVNAQCAEAISSVAGGFSQPYVMNIHLDDSSTASQLSPRQISVSFSPVFGMCALTQVPSSAPLNVTGVPMVTEEVTTDTTTEQSTTPAEEQSKTPAEGTTTGLDPSTAHSTQESTSTPESTTTISTTRPPSSFSEVHTAILVVGVLVVVIVVAGFLLVCMYTRHRRKPAAVAEKKSDVESNTKEIHAVENTAEVKLPDVRNNMVDSGIVADGQLSFAESKTTGLPSPPCKVESLRKSVVQTPSTGQSERRMHNTSPLVAAFINGVDTPKSQRAESACSETESEGSEVHLIKAVKQLANGLQENITQHISHEMSQHSENITKRIIQQGGSLTQHITDHSESLTQHVTKEISQQTGQLSHQHEEIFEDLNYVSGRVDEINISR